MKNRKNPKDGGRGVSGVECLKAMPYRNEAMELTRRSDGTVLASIPMRRPRWLVPPFSWMLPYSSHRRVELDALGAAVVDACDGERTVEAIFE